jgi:hypothetical protein
MGITQLLQCEGVVFMLFPGLHLWPAGLIDGATKKIRGSGSSGKFRGLAQVRSTVRDEVDAAWL